MHSISYSCLNLLRIISVQKRLTLIKASFISSASCASVVNIFRKIFTKIFLRLPSEFVSRNWKKYAANSSCHIFNGLYAPSWFSVNIVLVNSI